MVIKTKKLNTKVNKKIRNNRNDRKLKSLKKHKINRTIKGGGIEPFYEGRDGCTYKVTDDSGNITIRKISVYGGQEYSVGQNEYFQRELKINALLSTKSKTDPSLSEHFVLMKSHEIIKGLDEVKRAGYNCNTDFFLLGQGTNNPADIEFLLLDMPYGGITLSNFLNKSENQTQKIKVDIINKTLESLKKLHELGICHGDFHTKNVLIDSETTNITAKIIDFGQSQIIQEITNLDEFIRHGIGTLDWIFGSYLKSPEFGKLIVDNNITLKLDLLRFIFELRIAMSKDQLTIGQIKSMLQMEVDGDSYNYEKYKSFIGSCRNMCAVSN